jgi:tetratricopeptide (TPR) repeat protein
MSDKVKAAIIIAIVGPLILLVATRLLDSGLLSKIVSAPLIPTQPSLPVVQIVPTYTLSPQWQYWHDLGIAYFAAGKYDDMLDAIKSAADLAPTNTDWITNIGEQLHRKGGYATAESVLRLVRIRNNADKLAIYWLAWALYEQKKYEDARGHFLKCIDSYKNETFFVARCHSGIGFAWKAKGNYSSAKQEFEISLGILPNQADVIKAVATLP